MIICIDSVQRLTDGDLLASTARLVEREHGLTAELLIHLGEVDDRRLYLGRAFASMFAFAVGELGFSEDAAYNRITVARLARRFPEVIETVRSGRVHLSGLRLLAPHLTEDNHLEILDEAAGKSKRDIEEMIAKIAPRPPVPATIRKLPEPRSSGGLVPREVSQTEPPASVVPPILAAVAPPRALELRPVVKPLAEETFRVQFTARRSLRDKLQEAQDLLRHQVPDHDLAQIVERAVDLLIAEVKKKRFAVGRTARTSPEETEVKEANTRHIPDAIKRAVYQRDGGRCAFVDERGRRCPETGGLELDHLDGFARTRTHALDRIRLTCRAHNRHLANQMYGDEFMEAAIATSMETRSRQKEQDTGRPGTSRQPQLL